MTKKKTQTEPKSPPKPKTTITQDVLDVMDTQFPSLNVRTSNLSIAAVSRSEYHVMAMGGNQQGSTVLKFYLSPSGRHIISRYTAGDWEDELRERAKTARAYFEEQNNAQ